MTVTAALGLGGLVSAAEPALRDGDGVPVAWATWMAERGPAAVVVYASWAPRADRVLLEIGDLDAAARSRGLRLVLLAVQEPFEDARAALASADVDWVHDRHGALLKRYRVLRVPSVLVVGVDGEVLASTDADAARLRAVTLP